MTIDIDSRLSNEQVYSLLLDFDEAFDPALHTEVDLLKYSQKLSSNAYFILAKDEEQIIGFIAYYINIERNYCYIPLLAISKHMRGIGLGQALIKALESQLNYIIPEIYLEVNKTNNIALRLYLKENFNIVEDRGIKLLLKKTSTI